MANELSCVVTTQSTSIGAPEPNTSVPLKPLHETTGLVFVVTSGSYSDYSIDAIFSSQTLAEEYIKKMSRQDYPNDYDIEEWTVDAEKVGQPITIWGVGIALDTGEILENPWSAQVVETPFRGRVTQACIAVPIYGGQKLARVQSGVSDQHALKLAYEARQAYLRNEPWVEGPIYD